MRPLTALAVLSLACTAACGQGADAAPPAAKSNAATMKPGLWLVEITAPDGTVETSEECVTQANPLEQMFLQTNAADQDCDFERRAVGGGKVDVLASCLTPDGRAEIAVKGTFDTTTFDTKTHMIIAIGGGDPAQIDLRAKGRHVAPACSPDTQS